MISNIADDLWIDLEQIQSLHLFEKEKGHEEDCVCVVFKNSIDKQYDGDQYVKGFKKHLTNKINKWIPMTDKLPEDGEEVIIYYIYDNKHEWIYFARFSMLENGKHYFYARYKIPYKQVTHWQPLPNKP